MTYKSGKTGGFLLISIIVPVYNVETFLRQCLDSIINQTYKDLEIILVDDCSPDECGKICDEYSEKDDRIRVVHNEVNRGLSVARNVGLDEAKGDYIGFVDSDDWIETDMYDCLLKAIEDADVSVCCYWIENQKSIQKKLNSAIYTGIGSLKALLNNDINNNVWNKLFRKELFTTIRFPVGRHFEDVATMHRILYKANKCVVVPDLKYHYQRREGSISMSKKAQILLELADAYLERYRFCTSLNKLPEDVILSSAAKGISKVWRWWYGCTKDEKREYRKQVDKLYGFTKANIPLLGYRSWKPYQRLSSMFMHSDKDLLLAILYYINQCYRLLNPGKAI